MKRLAQGAFTILLSSIACFGSNERRLNNASVFALNASVAVNGSGTIKRTPQPTPLPTTSPTQYPTQSPTPPTPSPTPVPTPMPMCDKIDVVGAGDPYINGLYEIQKTGCIVAKVFHNNCFKKGKLTYLIRTSFDIWQLGIMAGQKINYYYKVQRPRLFQAHPVANGWVSIGIAKKPAPTLKALPECILLNGKNVTSSNPANQGTSKESFKLSIGAIVAISAAGGTALVTILFFHCGCYRKLLVKRRNLIALRQMGDGILSQNQVAPAPMT